MNKLTERQKYFIENNKETSVAELAKKLKVDREVIEEYIQILNKPVGTRKKIAFRLIAVSLPVLFFLLLEVILRVVDYGPNLDIFNTFINNPKYLVTNAYVGRRFFFVKEINPATSYDAILKQKPKNGYRIFVLGGSTAAGFPYYNNGAFPRMLATRLEDAFPSRDIEVFNLALPAINSYAILDFVDELIDYQPDAFLIYAGHNEFYGALGVGSTEILGKYRGVVNLYLKLVRYKTFYLVRSFIGWVKFKALVHGDTPLPLNATLMERMVGNKQIQINSPEYLTAQETFRQNLNDICKIAKENNIKVLLSNLVSNVRDHAPFESVYNTSTKGTSWQKYFKKGQELLTKQQYQAAFEAFRKAEKIDSEAAILKYNLAKCLEKLGKYDAAKSEYYAAKDLDALRFRASEDFNKVIEDVAQQNDVDFVDMKKRFEAASPNSLIGNNLMHEHLHPNLKGYFLMAKEFFYAMKTNGFISLDWDATKIKSEKEYAQRAAVTPLDEETANIRIQVLMNGWPFKSRQSSSPFDYKPKNEIQKIAYDVFLDKLTWESGHVGLAEYYEKTKDLQFAAKEYEALVRGTPYNISPYLRLGIVYLEMKYFDKALNVFKKSLKVEETAIANKWIGSIFVNSGETREGVSYLEKSLKLNAADPETLFNISVAFARSNEFDSARHYCDRLIKDYPNHPGARQLWEGLAAK